jgi:1-acyl-sn-glycerol-3-phosphate acyltransferase
MNVGGKMRGLLRTLFVVCVAYPVVLLWLGIHVRHRDRLPVRGPAIVAANHNSHLDILTLLSLFPLLSIWQVQPAAAADYFFKTPLLKWFSLNVISIIPVTRGGARQGADPLEACYSALEAGKILIIFPEGTRGEPEQMAELKSGIWFLSKRFPDVPVVPVFMHGLGKSMPKGSWIPIPFFVRIVIGRPLYWTEQKEAFIAALKDRFDKLKQKIYPIREAP